VSASDIRALVLWTAQKNLGFGEEGANNAGRFIHAIGGRDGQEWCALFAGYCYEKAFERYGEIHPEWLYRRPGVPEPGAKRLVDALGKGGVRFKRPEDALPGDLVAWRRGLTKGHVAVVERVSDGLVHTIEGNTGAFPAKVRRLVHDVSKERLYTFAGLR
jgi:hypothetical protein